MKLSKRILATLMALAMLMTVLTSYTVITILAAEADDVTEEVRNDVYTWKLCRAIGRKVNLNATDDHTPFTIYQVLFDSVSAETGTFSLMTYNDGGYKYNQAADGPTLAGPLHVTQNTSLNLDSNQVSIGLATNTDNGKCAGIAFAFTAPLNGTYRLDAIFELAEENQSTTSDETHVQTQPEWYTLTSQNGAKENVNRFNGASGYKHTMVGSDGKAITYDLKAGETIYLVADPNGNHWQDGGKLSYNVTLEKVNVASMQLPTPQVGTNLVGGNLLFFDGSGQNPVNRNAADSKSPFKFMGYDGLSGTLYMLGDLNASDANMGYAGNFIQYINNNRSIPVSFNNYSGPQAVPGGPISAAVLAFIVPADGNYTFKTTMNRIDKTTSGTGYSQSWVYMTNGVINKVNGNTGGVELDKTKTDVLFDQKFWHTEDGVDLDVTVDLKAGEVIFLVIDSNNDGSWTDHNGDALDLGDMSVVCNSLVEAEAPETPAPTYTANLGTTYQEVTENEDVTFTVTADKAFASGEVVLTYDPSVLTFKSSTAKAHKAENGTLTLETYGMDDATTIDVVFTAVAVADSTTVTLTKAAFSTATEAETSDLTAATVGTASASVAVLADTYTVVLGDNLATLQGQTGSVTVANGTALSFKVADTFTALYKDIVVKAGDEVLTAVEGVYTIDYAATVTVTGTPKTFTVTVEGDDYADVTVDPEEPTYLTPFKVTLPDNKNASLTDNGYTYSAKITIGGVDYAVVTEKVTTIAGDKITGDVVITVTKTEVPKTGVSITVTGDVTVAGDYARTATKGEAYTLTITPVAGYAYTVTAQVNGVAVELAKDGNKYTVAAADVTGDITFEITAEVASEGLTVDKYLTLDGDNDLWLVKMVGDLADGKVYKYGETVLVWSDNYDAYVCLVLSADEPALELTIVDGELYEIEYTNDINGTEVIDANDAQLVYNMYNSTYTDFTTVSMMKFLLADVNADSTVDVQDAAAIVNAILGNA